MDLNATTKVCSRCRIPLDRSAFRKQKGRKDGLFPQCKTCERAYADANKERIAAYQAQYREANKVKLYADKAIYRRANRDHILAKSARYRAENPDLVRAGKKRCYEAKKDQYNARVMLNQRANPERTRRWKQAWVQRNPVKKQEYRMRYNARKAKATIEPVDYEAIRKRDNGICHICHNPVPTSRLHYDHVIPLVKGGAHSMENIKVSHARCNLRKGSKLV